MRVVRDQVCLIEDLTPISRWYGYEYCYLFHSFLRTIYLGWSLI